METNKLAGKGKRIELSAANLNLLNLLQCRNIDIKRFDPIGAEFYQQFENCFNVGVVCIDRQKLMNNESYLIKIILEDLTQEEYSQFERKFEGVINSDKKMYYNLNFSEVLLQSEVTINYISNGKFAT